MLLGIGASLLVPAFLKMISSNLATSADPNDYLIFAGFCLVAAIFSRRFITTIGEKILEAAKQAQRSASASKMQSESTQLQLTSAKERIEDVKLAVELNSSDQLKTIVPPADERSVLVDLALNYVERTSVADYPKRLTLKSEFGRKMGEIIVRQKLSKHQLLQDHFVEGMFVGIAYSVDLYPDLDGLEALKKIAPEASQLNTKYVVLVAFDTLIRRGLVAAGDIAEVLTIVQNYKKNADGQLLHKIEGTLNLLQINSTVQP